MTVLEVVVSYLKFWPVLVALDFVSVHLISTICHSFRTFRVNEVIRIISYILGFLNKKQRDNSIENFAMLLSVGCEVRLSNRILENLTNSRNCRFDESRPVAKTGIMPLIPDLFPPVLLIEVWAK
jgi:hypothetical protein